MVDEPLPTAPLPAPDVPAGGPGRVPRGGRDLPIAIASGVALAVGFLATLAWSDYAFLTFVAVVVTIGLLEVLDALRRRGLAPVTPVAVVAGLVMLYGAYAIGPAAQALGLLILIGGSVAGALAAQARRPGAPVDGVAGPGVAARIGATCLATLWVPFMASFLGLLLTREDGRWLVAAVIALTVSADIGAYGFGRPFGRHRLAPRVSPGKTWEGTAGALCTVLLLAALVTARVVDGLGLPGALLLGVGIVVAGTLGDLAESLVKRDLDVKDLGTIVPGHGGIMDRVDAMVFTLPVSHLLLLALGV